MRFSMQAWVTVLVSVLLAYPLSGQAAKLDALDVPSKVLQGNPLGDPSTRRVAIFAPDGSENSRIIPLVIYLPGWGGSSEDAIAQGTAGIFAKAVDQLTSQGLLIRIAVVDGRSRYGGSQFLNSSATGRYADYISHEILQILKARYGVPGKESPVATILAGHSSGAYGALMLTMDQQQSFDAVVALSPDSDFGVTHKPLVQAASVRAITSRDLEIAMSRSGNSRLPGDGLAQLIMGLCANYAPVPNQPGRFEWLYDETGKWRPEAWQRWLDLDPLSMVQRRANAFAPTQRIYLDGAEHDEFGANIGARKIYEVLRGRKSPVSFYESPGGHSDHLVERLVRGLAWVLKK